jgi:hypothetical protein
MRRHRRKTGTKIPEPPGIKPGSFRCGQKNGPQKSPIPETGINGSVGNGHT